MLLDAVKMFVSICYQRVLK